MNLKLIILKQFSKFSKQLIYNAIFLEIQKKYAEEFTQYFRAFDSKFFKTKIFTFNFF